MYDLIPDNYGVFFIRDTGDGFNRVMPKIYLEIFKDYTATNNLRAMALIGYGEKSY